MLGIDLLFFTALFAVGVAGFAIAYARFRQRQARFFRHRAHDLEDRLAGARQQVRVFQAAEDKRQAQRIEAARIAAVKRSGHAKRKRVKAQQLTMETLRKTGLRPRDEVVADIRRSGRRDPSKLPA